MQQVFVFSVLLLWLALSMVLSLSFATESTCAKFYLLWTLLFCLPFFLRPFAWTERQFRSSMTLTRRRQRRAWVHLAPWQRTTDLTPARVRLFWQAVYESTCQALEQHHIVIISSHLLTDIRAHRLLAQIENSGLDVYSLSYRIPFNPFKKSLMQLEILFRQWHWRTNFRCDWPVLVVRNKTAGRRYVCRKS